MIIIGFILFGMLVGAIAQVVLGKSKTGIDWSFALVAGIAGSFVGGLIGSALWDEGGLRFRPSGIIGSVVGAIIVTVVWHGVRGLRS